VRQSIFRRVRARTRAARQFAQTGCRDPSGAPSLRLASAIERIGFDLGNFMNTGSEP
jgi:hypothetical protein